MRLGKRFKEIHGRPELLRAGSLGEIAAHDQQVVPPPQQVGGEGLDDLGVLGAEVDVADMGDPPHGADDTGRRARSHGGKMLPAGGLEIIGTGRGGRCRPITWQLCRLLRSSFALS